MQRTNENKKQRWLRHLRVSQHSGSATLLQKTRKNKAGPFEVVLEFFLLIFFFNKEKVKRKYNGGFDIFVFLNTQAQPPFYKETKKVRPVLLSMFLNSFC
jgi:hypothetical protein